MSRFSRTVASRASIITLVTLGSVLPAQVAAQSTDTAAETLADGGDIVVTARKRAESIQTVPISITALNAQDLADRNISNLNDLANTTPGISVTSVGGGTFQSIFIRGLAPANVSTDLNVEANVGIFIDDIYQSSRNTIDMISVLDVGQIEIAKGPQSALFGRSTFAGAMSISTRRPTRAFEGNVSATVGQDDDYRIRGSISAPLTDTLSLRVGGGYLTYDGYGRNAADRGDNLGGTEKYAFTGSLEYAPTTEFTARLSGFLTSSKSDLSPVYVAPLADFNCGTVNIATGQRTQYCGEVRARKVSSITPDTRRTKADTRQVSLNLNWRHEGVSVTSITGFAGAENVTTGDYDGSAAGTLFGVCNGFCLPTGAYTRLVRINLLSSNRERLRSFSQEVRLQSDNDSPFQWIFGGNYFDSRIPLAAGGISADGTGIAAGERLVQVDQINTPGATGVGAFDFTANPFLTASALSSQVYSSYTAASTKTMSIFGSLGYRFGALRVGAEGRYNIDRKRAQTFSINNALAAPGIYAPIDGSKVPATGLFPVVSQPFARTFESFTPRITVDYQVMRDIFAYASAAKGVRSGGFNTANPVGPTGILPDEVAFDEESNWTYEAGLKTHLFDRRLLFNVSAFHVDWTNAQVSAFTLNPTTVNPTRIVRNAGNIKTNGVEVQSELKVFDYLNLGGSLVYSDPKFQAGAYDASIVAQCIIGTGTAAIAAPGCPSVIQVTTPSGTRAATSIEGNRPVRSVQLQWNVHATTDVALSKDWNLSGRVDVSHTGKTYSTLINTSSFGARTLTNLRIGVENERYSLALWANNLFNVLYTVNTINQPRAGVPFVFSQAEIYLGETRRVGLTASAKF